MPTKISFSWWRKLREHNDAWLLIINSLFIWLTIVLIILFLIVNWQLRHEMKRLDDTIAALNTNTQLTILMANKLLITPADEFIPEIYMELDSATIKKD